MLAKILRRAPNAEAHSCLYDFYHRPHTTCERAQRLLGKKYDSLFAFAVVREPLDWLLSCYFHFLRWSKEECQPIPDYGSSFEQYVYKMIELGERKPCQGYMIISNNGRILVDAIGLYNDINLFCSRIGNRLNLHLPDLPKINANPLSPTPARPKPALSTAMKSLVEEHWRLDFTIWSHVNSHRNDFALKSSSLARLHPPSIDLSTYDPWSYMKR